MRGARVEHTDTDGRRPPGTGYPPPPRNARVRRWSKSSVPGDALSVCCLLPALPDRRGGWMKSIACLLAGESAETTPANATRAVCESWQEVCDQEPPPRGCWSRCSLASTPQKGEGGGWCSQWWCSGPAVGLVVGRSRHQVRAAPSHDPGGTHKDASGARSALPGRITGRPWGKPSACASQGRFLGLAPHRPQRLKRMGCISIEIEDL